MRRCPVCVRSIPLDDRDDKIYCSDRCARIAGCRRYRQAHPAYMKHYHQKRREVKRMKSLGIVFGALLLLAQPLRADELKPAIQAPHFPVPVAASVDNGDLSKLEGAMVGDQILSLSTCIRKPRSVYSWCFLKPGDVIKYFYAVVTEDGDEKLRPSTHRLRNYPDKRPLSESRPNVEIGKRAGEATLPWLGGVLAGLIGRR